MSSLNFWEASFFIVLVTCKSELQYLSESTASVLEFIDKKVVKVYLSRRDFCNKEVQTMLNNMGESGLYIGK